jgi:exonuclease SbcC
MLERLQIKNFQKHELLRINCGQPIVAITGPSDIGKSSVLRAFRWLATNRPRGSGFLKHGADDTSVKIRIDGIDIERKKGKAGNTYKINGKQLEAFGTDVPEQILQILKLDDVNFQGQHDPQFWFSLTAGEVAKRLNNIVDLGLIDTTTSKLASMLRKAKAEQEVVEERLAKAEAEAEELGYVPKLDKELIELERADEEKSTLTQRASICASSVAQAGEYHRTAKTSLERHTDALRACSKGEEAIGLRKQWKKLAAWVEEIKGLGNVVRQKLPDLGVLETLKKKADESIIEAEELIALVNKGNSVHNRIITARKKWKNNKTRLEKETEGMCPICGNELK